LSDNVEVIVKVASYNIHKCRGTDRLVRPGRIIEVLAEIGADLVALQEVDHRFGQRSGMLDPEAIHRETGLTLLVQSDVNDGHGWHGNALLVRGVPNHYRRLRIKLPGIEPRGAIVAELDFGEGKVRIIAAHLGLLRRSRIDQAIVLLRAFLHMAPMPTIMLGDFNEWRFNHKSSLGILEPFFGNEKQPKSFPSQHPLLALDRIYGWPAGLVTEVTAHNTPLSRKASDHLPLTAHVNLKAIPAIIEPAA
jgi:endonuclease/exonuclease/phosphatase family metal-dependent hydrolase